MIQTINTALSLLTKLDPQASQLLRPMDKKAISVNITDINYTTTLHFENGQIHATNDESKNILSGNLAYIIEVVFNKNIQELIIDKKLNYQGSLKDLNQFNSFLNAIDIDLIYKISQKTSPEFAGVIAKPFQKVKEYINHLDKKQL